MAKKISQKTIINFLIDTWYEDYDSVDESYINSSVVFLGKYKKA
jgi:hypothetical protein